MGILNVVLQTESGKVVESIGKDPHDLDRMLPPYEDTKFPYLRCLDRYGDTTFNYLQMEQFLEEWARLRSKAKTLEDIALFEGVEGLAKKCRDSIHYYLKFMGD